MLDQKAGESPMLYRDTENRLMLVQNTGDSLTLLKDTGNSLMLDGDNGVGTSKAPCSQWS